MEKWYAVLRDSNDADWGYGSYNKREAAKMVRRMRRDGEKEAYIAVIDVSGHEPMCIDTIHDVRGM